MCDMHGVDIENNKTTMIELTFQNMMYSCLIICLNPVNIMAVQITIIFIWHSSLLS